MTATDTICPYCGVGCTLRLHVDDGEIVKATSPLENSITQGNLCIKGRFGWRFVQPRDGAAARRQWPSLTIRSPGSATRRASAARSFVRLTGDSSSESSAEVAEEVPIAFVYNGRPYVVVMGTPSDLDDLAVGFSITEGIVADASRIEHVDAVRANHGIELQIRISSDDAERLGERVRGLVSRTGCGLCGVETIGDALRVPPEVGHSLRVDRSALWRASARAVAAQSVNNATSTVHGAAGRRAAASSRSRARTSGATTRSTRCSVRSAARGTSGGQRIHRRHQPRELRDGAEGGRVRRRARRRHLAADRSWRFDSPTPRA